MSLGIGDIIKPVQDALTPVGNTLSDAWQIVLGDRIAAWRLTNAAKIQVKVRQQLSALGMQANAAKIPERYAAEWFEEATKQDEDDIQELFAKLLAKASGGDQDALDRRHVGLITQLTPIDANVFNLLVNMKLPDDKQAMMRSLLGIRWEAIKLERGLALEYEESYVGSLEHLKNIGILDKEFEVVSDKTNRLRSDLSGRMVSNIRYETQQRYRLTRLGASLCLALR